MHSNTFPEIFIFTDRGAVIVVYMVKVWKSIFLKKIDNTG